MSQPEWLSWSQKKNYMYEYNPIDKSGCICIKISGKIFKCSVKELTSTTSLDIIKNCLTNIQNQISTINALETNSFIVYDTLNIALRKSITLK